MQEPELIGTVRPVIEGFDGAHLFRHPDGRHELRHFTYVGETEAVLEITEREAARLLFAT